MSLLVELISCKLCKATIEIPPLPVIVGETAEQKGMRIGALELATLIKHLSKSHPDMRDHSIAWANVFSEFYFLAQFDLKDCQMLLDRYDAQRLLLLGLCQRPTPETEDFPGHPATPEVVTYYEETERVAELEKAGYTITRGFLGGEVASFALMRCLRRGDVQPRRIAFSGSTPQIYLREFSSSFRIEKFRSDAVRHTTARGNGRWIVVSGGKAKKVASIEDPTTNDKRNTRRFPWHGAVYPGAQATEAGRPMEAPARNARPRQGLLCGYLAHGRDIYARRKHIAERLGVSCRTVSPLHRLPGC